MISIYVSQPRLGEDVIDAHADGSGHSGIGIEFSRKSNITGEWERYNLRFGYYMAGGISTVPATAVMAYNRALVPGQLMDERNKKYDISRSYKINNQQVNAVLKAAETYPDKGYNNFTRNCTTFAKEMVVNHAHVPAGDAIFQKEGIDFSSKQNFMLMGAGAFSQWNKAEMEQNLTKLTSGADTNYQGYGNKRMTREEYDQYHNSLRFFKGAPTEADTPNGAAENMRRLEGQDRGTVGSFNWAGDGVATPIAVLTRMSIAADDIRPILQQITPADKLEDAHYQNAVRWVSGMGRALLGIDDFSDINSKGEFQRIRASLTEDIDNLNTVLFDYYKNDKRLHLPIINAISLLTTGILGVDAAYKSFMERTGVEEDELDNIRVQFISNKNDIVFDGKHTIEMTPSRYEAYLQVYNTPRAAVNAILRYNELCGLNENLMNPEQKKELQKLGRMQALIDDFEKSHRYMLEKKAYTQQDVDYAFALDKKEQSTQTGGDMISGKKTASSTYKTLFLEKIFGGMKGRYKDYRDNREKDVRGRAQLMMGRWLDDELYNCASPKRDEIKMILNGILKSMKKNMDRFDLVSEFQFFFKDNWIKKLYDVEDRNSEEYNDLILATDSIRSNGRFRRLLDDLADEVIDEYKKLNAGPESVYSDDDDD